MEKCGIIPKNYDISAENKYKIWKGQRMEVKKKKIVVCLMIILMLVFASGCGSSDTASGNNEMDPLEMYTIISERVDELSSMEAQLTTTVFVNNSVESLELSMTSDIKQIGNQIIGADVEMRTSTRYLDESLTVTSYYTDGYYYTDYNGEKIKYKFSNEDMMAENHLSLPQIDEKYIKDIVIEFDGDDNVVLTLLTDPAMFLEMAKDLGDIFDDENADFFNCSDMTIVVRSDEEGNIQSCDYLVSMNVTEEGVTTEYTIDAYIEYLSINEKIEIDFPDLSQYKEVYGD